MGVFDIFRRKRLPTDSERRERLLKTGRISEGTILDSESNASGDEIVYYVYTVNGADFESSEILTAVQAQTPMKYAPGAKVNVRFDPKNHSNSVLE